MQIKIVSVAHHRNGTMGNSFHVVLFRMSRHGEPHVGVVFEEKGNVAVFDITKLIENDIAFGSNSFDGAAFEADLRAAVKEYEDGRSSKAAEGQADPHEKRQDDVR